MHMHNNYCMTIAILKSDIAFQIKFGLWHVGIKLDKKKSLKIVEICSFKLKMKKQRCDGIFIEKLYSLNLKKVV